MHETTKKTTRKAIQDLAICHHQPLTVEGTSAAVPGLSPPPKSHPSRFISTPTARSSYASVLENFCSSPISPPAARTPALLPHSLANSKAFLAASTSVNNLNATWTPCSRPTECAVSSTAYRGSRAFTALEGIFPDNLPSVRNIPEVFSRARPLPTATSLGARRDPS